MIALCTQNVDCSFEMTERRHKLPALSEIVAIVGSGKSFGRRVSRALGADQRALEESLVILMPALYCLKPCHIRDLAGLGCVLQRLINMAKQARLRFLIPHPAR